MDTTKLELVRPWLLPFGVIDPTQDMGRTWQESQIIKGVLREMQEKNLLTEMTCQINDKTETITCLKLTGKGIKCVVRSCDALKAIWDRDDLIAADKMGDNAKLRLVRRTNAKNYLLSCGADTAWTGIAKGYDPFVAGLPYGGEGSRQFHTAVIWALTKYLEQNNFPRYNNGALFLTSAEIEPFSESTSASGRDKGRRKLRYYNNTVGCLINITHGDAYYVFCDFSGAKMRWFANAYKILRANMSKWLEKYHISADTAEKWKRRGNINVYGYSSSAIILCPNQQDRWGRLVCVPRLKDPYDHIHGVVMDNGGRDQITAMIKLGEMCYRSKLKEWICKKMPDIIDDENIVGNIIYDDTVVVMLATFDYRVLWYEIYHAIVRGNGKIPYVVCHSWDAPAIEKFISSMYRKRAKLKSDMSQYIFTLDDDWPRAWGSIYPLIPTVDCDRDYLTGLPPAVWPQLIDDRDDIIEITSSTDAEIEQICMELMEWHIK